MPPTDTRERSVSCHYDPELTAARKARAHVCRTLSSWGLGDHADVAELIISELVANAVGHGEGPVKTRISYDGRYLHLEVHDDGPGRPVVRPGKSGGRYVCELLASLPESSA